MQSRSLRLLALLTGGLFACSADTPPTAPNKPEGPPLAPDLSLSATGQWSRLTNFPARIAIHSHLLPNGKVLFWPGEEGPHKGTKGFQYAFVWDPVSGSTVQVDNRRNDVFCSGHSFLPDGRLLVAGGHHADYVGRRDVSIFDFTRNRWSAAPAMAKGRWYPTNTTLPSGEVLTIAGTDESAQPNTVPEVWTGSGWRQLTGASLTLPYYPRTFVAPNGRVFYAGEERATRYLSTGGAGSWSFVANSNFGSRDYGTAVMYAKGKVLIVGGGGSAPGTLPTNTAETIDLNAGTPVWQYTGSMSVGRRQLNATVLPDGTVLVTGGTSGSGSNNERTPVYSAELWNPATGTWTTLGSMTTPRLYHSTALLLPDGRVLSGGGGRCSMCTVDHPNADVFAPPYLFRGPRPTITSAPASVTTGTSFTVQTPNPTAIQRVTLIGLSSVTHAFNMGQRFLELGFTRGTGSITVGAPANRNDAPPGHYLLFVLDANGIPSVGKIVRVG